MDKRKERSAHRRAYQEVYGEIPSGRHIHHIDGDHRNNEPDNLIAVSREMHQAFHLHQWLLFENPADAYAYNMLGGENPIPLEGEKNGFYGKEHSEEQKQKWSEQRSGVRLSEEHKRKLSEAKKGNKNVLGRKLEYDPIIYIRRSWKK